MSIHDIQFTVSEETVRGRLHLPMYQGFSVPGVLIIPGFADTAVGPHNMHVLIARALVQMGVGVLRFDYRGQGESEGNFRNFTALSGRDDARAALEILLSLPEIDSTRLGVIGYSLGGALACELAADFPAIQIMGLLAPVAHLSQVFHTFFSTHHQEQGRQQGWMDWLGWAVGYEFLTSLDTLKPLAALKRSHAKTLIIHGDADAEVPFANGEAYAAQGATLQTLEGGDHQFASIALQEMTIQILQAWFQKYWFAEKRNRDGLHE